MCLNFFDRILLELVMSLGQMKKVCWQLYYEKTGGTPWCELFRATPELGPASSYPQVVSPTTLSLIII